MFKVSHKTLLLDHITSRLPTSIPTKLHKTLKLHDQQIKSCRWILVSSQTSTIDPSCYTQRKDLWLILRQRFYAGLGSLKVTDSHRNSKGGQMVSHLQQPIHVRLKLSWGGHAHLHRKQTRDKSIHHPFVTILSWQTLLSCDLVLHNLFNPTLPRQKHFYSPNRHHPSSFTEEEEEEESKLSSIYEQNQARPMEQSEITGFKPHISSHPMKLVVPLCASAWSP